MIYTYNDDEPPFLLAPFSDVQIVACNIVAANTTISVDVESAQPDISTSPDLAQWQDWTPLEAPSQPWLSPVRNISNRKAIILTDNAVHRLVDLQRYLR